MKKYLIIGASSGIGKCITTDLTTEGHIVYATYNTNPIADTSNVKSIHLDVTSSQLDLTALPDMLDGVVYCPGSIQLKPFLRISRQELEADFSLQVTGAFRILQHAVPLLRKNGQGSVVLFSTVATGKGFPFHTLVSASKGAIEGMARALAAELSPTIRVNCIAPSITDTPLAKRLLDTDEKKQQHAMRHPLKRIGTPGDIAATVLFLLSDKSSWITGQVLHVDGGLSTIS